MTVDIDPNDALRRGRVAVHGEVWGALSRENVGLPVGSRVRITEMQGTRVVVEPVAPIRAEGERP